MDIFLHKRLLKIINKFNNYEFNYFNLDLIQYNKYIEIIQLNNLFKITFIKKNIQIVINYLNIIDSILYSNNILHNYKYNYSYIFNSNTAICKDNLDYNYIIRKHYFGYKTIDYYINDKLNRICSTTYFNFNNYVCNFDYYYNGNKINIYKKNINHIFLNYKIFNYNLNFFFDKNSTSTKYSNNFKIFN